MLANVVCKKQSIIPKLPFLTKSRKLQDKLDRDGDLDALHLIGGLHAINEIVESETLSDIGLVGKHSESTP
jgi:hypothetical protein